MVIEKELALPFETTVLGVPVKLTKNGQADDGNIVEVCRRETQRIDVLDPPPPGPTSAGVHREVPITGDPGVERRRMLGPSYLAARGGGLSPGIAAKQSRFLPARAGAGIGAGRWTRDDCGPLAPRTIEWAEP
jgi:hypothetical protein